MITTIRALAIAVFFATLPLMGTSAAKAADRLGETLLQTVAQGNQAEIALGQLAIQKGESLAVKQFGARMIQDHQKASQEVQQLASKAGVALPMQMSEDHKVKYYELSQLSGRPFDLAYMQNMVEDHENEVNEFELTTKQVQDQDLQNWASSTLPVLKEHLDLATTVAGRLDPMNTNSSMRGAIPGSQ